ncbi:unnamed protein product [Brassicogethes aeneus]|uniref:EGF-like domain-containing protein n=1 Tax=Brassicogethes aeneus TaxID=1431903 RepID=A0A9P0FKR4_BRAAE|nr:unnamed protein product [Brassicogethes aeneus]
MTKRVLWIQLFIFVYFMHLSYQGYVNQSGPMLLYSAMVDIRMTNTTKGSNNKIKTTVIVKNYSQYISAIDFHFEQKKVCFADHGIESIVCTTYTGNDNENKTYTKIISDVPSPDGLACDWYTNKLYWTDSIYNRIEVATMEGKDRRVLFWTDLDQPRAIAVAPLSGLMFWTDWGETPKIERAGMNGDPKTRKAIVSEKIFWPNGLTVDYKLEMIYWVDGKLLFIKQMDYDGKQMSTILSSGMDYPFAITHIGSKLYWTDWKTRAIHYFDKNSDQKPTELLFVQESHVLMDVHVWSKERQPKNTPNPCEKNNGGCSHLCLLSPIEPRYSCSCGIGIKLIDKFNCADSPQELLLLARRQDIYLVHLDSPDYTHKVLPLTNVTYAIAVDYDPVDNFLYWTDDDVKKIQRARLNGSEEQEVVSTEITNPDGLAIDWLSRNLYWTDAGTDRIEVVRINKNFRRVIISDGLVDPRGIAVAPELGWLFWSDWNEKEPKVERSNTDGSERIAIVSKELGWPNGITLDLVKRKIYWCDAKADKIEYANMDGSERKVLTDDNVPHVFGFSLMGDYIYWTDWQRRSIERAHKESATDREQILDQTENVMGLKAFKLGPVEGWNSCKENNGGCSQFCFFRHNKTRVCLCQIDYELTDDKANCVKPNSFLLYTKKDSIGRIGIENEENNVTIPIQGIKQASAIDFYINTNSIYWSDSKLKTIMRAFINGSDPQKVIDLGLASPEGIAVDWLGLNIYWTDPVAQRIEVSRLTGSSRRTLLWGVYNPHSIVLDPVAGFMYWSEWDPSNSIRRAWMDGRNNKKLTDTKQATGLSLDNEGKRLYWVNIDKPAIISCDLDGNDKQVIKNDNFRPIGLALYKDHLYWSDEKTGDIIRANKKDGSNMLKIHSFPDSSATDLLVYHSTKQHQFNQCTVGNGGCTHLCLALPSFEEKTTLTCACPTHYTLVNKTECIPPSNFMIYSQRNLAVRLVPDTKECPEAVLPMQGLKAVKAIDFDPKDNYLYWIEGKSHSIKRLEASGNSANDITMVVSGNEGVVPFDLAVDTIGRLLFWTCSAENIINITRLDNTISFGHLESKEDEKPRLIAIHVTKRLLFYTDIGATPQLVRTRLDGSHKLTIAKANDIVAIAVDVENELIVWARSQTIYMANIEGGNMHVIVNQSRSKIKQLTVYSSFLYWVDDSQELQRLELISEKSSTPLQIQVPHITGLISVRNPEKNHSCFMAHQKKCSHFCIMDGKNPVCACPNGKKLQDDKRTCVVLPNCGKDRFTCTSQYGDPKECIPLSWRCDKQEDCRDGSDELDCPPCKANQFRCQDGLCIENKQLCDGYHHCVDKSDEMNCCKGFKCPHTEVCLEKALVCDGMDHCADGADENPALCIKTSKTNTVWFLVFVGIVFFFVLTSVIMYFQRKNKTHEEHPDQSEDSLSPMHPGSQSKIQKFRKGIPDVVRMSMLNGGSQSSTYDRRHVTGASSSSNTNNSSVACYPRETLNPPPSPATTAASTRGSSPSSRYRPYKHYRSINQPPPPTPVSTDICDESDYNYPTRGRYDGAPFPPPPTPSRSHCQNESCPPSPCSRSSTYFSPLPPPPSPVASPRGGYDS